MLNLPDYWNTFFGTLENLKALLFHMVEADGDSLANALSGVLSELTELTLPKFMDLSDDNIHDVSNLS